MKGQLSAKVLRKRRSVIVVIITLILVLGQGFLAQTEQPTTVDSANVLSESTENTEQAKDVLQRLEVKGRAPKTGYSRAEFGDGWARVGSCDMRNSILQRDLIDVRLGNDGCVVLSGTLLDPYTGEVISFLRGSTTSDRVQIDHVVALSDAWQKGAQALPPEIRERLANDPLNLLAVDGPANQQKGDSDAASWLPPNRSFRCRYVARQISVKEKYDLWVTEAERAVMIRTLNSCSGQRVPAVQ